MSQWEIHAKKIETLTKVAKLLGDQIQAQSKAINKLQNDVDWIKETLRRKDQGITTSQTNIESTIEEEKQEEIRTPDMDLILATEKDTAITTERKEKPSEKEELLQALNIIDNL